MLMENLYFEVSFSTDMLSMIIDETAHIRKAFSTKYQYRKKNITLDVSGLLMGCLCEGTKQVF